MRLFGMDHSADIHELKRQLDEANAELGALRDSEAEYRTLFNSFDEGFMEVEVVQDADGQVIDWRYMVLNSAFERLTGLKDVTGRLVSEFLPDLEPEWAERYTHVINTGEAVRFELPASGLGRWFTVYLARIGDAGSPRVAAFYNEITDRKRAEAALRQSEERQAFLLALSDALRPLADPDEIKFTAARLLGERLHVTRVFYFDVEADGDGFVLQRDYVNGVPSVAGRFSISQFDAHLAENWRSGRTVHSRDVESDQLYSPEQLAAFKATQARAWLGVPLVKTGRLVAVLGMSHAEARAWTPGEIALVEEVAERTWAAVVRARAEAGLRESERRYRELLDSIDEGFCVLEMIADDAGEFRDYRFLQTNPVFEAQTGLVDPIGRTAVELSPSLERWWIDTYGQVATTGEARRFEHGSEAMGRWFDVYAARVGEPDQLRVALLFRDISERRRAEGHRLMLIDELNHRVKNTLAIVQALAQQTFRPDGDPLAARRAFDMRLIALATAHDILTRENWASADLAELIRTALTVHAGKNSRTVAEGPPVRLSPQTAVSITLALHELATNAVKYGALSIEAGAVEVRWTYDEDCLSLTWLERDGPLVEPPMHRGFGTRLINRVFETEREVTVALEFPPAGLVCRIDAHLGAS